MNKSNIVMTKSFAIQKTDKQKVTRIVHLSRQYILTYIYQSANQYGGRAITQSYTVHQPIMGSSF